jgi:nucleotide-binding universal stress UspA family protein
MPEIPVPSLPVVVGVDGSACSGIAFEAALDEARRRGVRLVAVHGWLVTHPGLPLGGPAALDENTEERLAKALHAHVGELLDGAADVEVEERLEYGYAGRVLVDASSAAGLLVVGCRGLGAVRSSLLGSVSQYVLEHAACPVLVAHGDAVGRPRRVVVGTDGSPVSAEALRWADGEARRLDVPLTVLHAVTAAGSGLDPAGPAPRAESEVAAELRQWVDAALGAERSAEVEQVVETRSPTRALQDRSAQDVLVVVGRSGTGGFLRLGSVARKLASHAAGPVVVVRP